MKQVFIIASVCCLLVLRGDQLFAQVRLPRLISDSMILQRDAKVKIWGWASPAEKVAIEIAGKKYDAVTGSDGKWMTILSAERAGGPYNMTIKGINSITIRNILFGDIWLCSGQSNMQQPMERMVDRYPEELEKPQHPYIRRFEVPTAYNFKEPLEDLQSGNWSTVNATSIPGFYAIAYFFAKNLFKKYQIPIGLIQVASGGGPAEGWLSEDALKEFPIHLATAKRFKDDAFRDSISREDARVNKQWYSHVWENDKGMQEEIKWFEPGYDASGWGAMQVPGYWNNQGLRISNGVVWFRKEINLPVCMTGRPAKLRLGNIIDRDSVYVNGVFTGATGYQYPPRRYRIATGVLKPGKNIITIKVINYGGQGGFYKGKPYYLAVGKDSISLEGEWQYKLSVATGPIPGSTTFSYQPLGLYNAMISPLLNYVIKGVIWYQGEANTTRAEEYKELFPALISNWRQKWGLGNFPFLYVQLANYMEQQKEPSESDWAELREAQLQTLSVPNTAMVVAIDVGEWNDLHPSNKKDVGIRLALAAQKIAYGDKTVVHSGPLYKSMRIEDDKITIEFSNTGTRLIAKDGALRHFAIAGTDRNFVWANAEIKKGKIVVWEKTVSRPIAVRYAWADNPEDANLYNQEGLPASPFRTDTFPHPKKAGTRGWKNKNCAVALTYDDALNEHLDKAIPMLDSFGIKASFYLAGYSGVLNARFSEWKKAAGNGHELGNHTLSHPCKGKLPGREFVTADNDLDNYSIGRLVNEIRGLNALLSTLDGKNKRTFAYPCGDTRIGDSSYLDQMKDEFTGARGVRTGLEDLKTTDPYDFNAILINGQSGDELIELVKKAMAGRKLLVFLFHGVGGGHGLNVSLDAHLKLLQFLKENEKDIWVAPLTDIAEYIKQKKRN